MEVNDVVSKDEQVRVFILLRTFLSRCTKWQRV
jgi:hypothetical protein